MSDGYFNVMAFGAKGDGTTDDTAAIQATVDAAAKVGGTVFLPTGKYLSGEIKLYRGVVFKGETAYSYRTSYGSVLLLRDDATSTCLLNLNEAYGARVNSVCLVGRTDTGAIEKKDDSRIVHGIMIDCTKTNDPQEDAVAIDNCRIERFSGDAIRLEKIWCFSVRHSQAFFNKGCGIWCRGWDGFVIDCWLSANTAGGFVATTVSASNTLTGNRIEWNPGGGIIVKNGSHYNITGNYIDRSGNAAINLEDSKVFAISGNAIYRSGKPEWSNGNEQDSCHLRLKNCNGISFVGNSMNYGRDDGYGLYSPLYGMMVHNCTNTVVSQNTLFEGCLKTLLVAADNTDCVIKDNPGSVAVPPTE